MIAYEHGVCGGRGRRESTEHYQCNKKKTNIKKLTDYCIRPTPVNISCLYHIVNNKIMLGLLTEKQIRNRLGLVN